MEYVDGSSRIYFSTQRDICLAALLDGARMAGNVEISLNPRPANTGDRLIPRFLPSLIDDVAQRYFGPEPIELGVMKRILSVGE